MEDQQSALSQEQNQQTTVKTGQQKDKAKKRRKQSPDGKRVEPTQPTNQPEQFGQQQKTGEPAQSTTTISLEGQNPAAVRSTEEKPLTQIILPIQEPGVGLEAFEYSFQPVVNQPDPESDAQTLKSYERTLEQQLELMLPDQYEELRAYLVNDNFLSNEEISKALFDEQTTQEKMREHVEAVASSDTPEAVKEKITQYLGEIQQTILNSPLREGIDPSLSYSLQLHHLISGPTAARQLASQEQGVGDQPVQTLGDALNANRVAYEKITDEDQKSAFRKLLPVLEAKLFSGGMLANFVHNYQLLTEIHQDFVKKKDEVAIKQDTGPALSPEPTSPSLPDQQNLKRPETPTGLQQNQPDTTSTQPLTHTPTTEAGLGQRNTDTHSKIITQPINQSQPTQSALTMDNLPLSTPQPGVTRYTLEQIQPQLTRYGIDAASLGKENLNELLSGRKTGNLNLELNDGKGNATRLTDGLYIAEAPGKGPTIFHQAERPSISLPKSFLGHTFTANDKKLLTKEGNMGRVVDLRDRLTGETFKGYVGIDPERNSLTVTRQERINVNKTMWGVELNEKQKQSLLDGKKTLVMGMKDANGNTFDGLVQISAAKRRFAITRVDGQQLQKEWALLKQKPSIGNDLNTGTRQQITPDTNATKPKTNQQINSVKNVSIVEKNGVSRITQDTTKAKGPTNGPKNKKTDSAKTIQKNKVTVNGQSKQSTKKGRGGPRL